MHRIRWKVVLASLLLSFVSGLVPISPASAEDETPPPEVEDPDKTPIDDLMDVFRTFLGDDGGAKMEGDGTR